MRKETGLNEGGRLAGVVAVVLLLCTGTAGASESYWPTWRGPAQDGVSPDGDPPVSWSESENVKWKVKVEGRSLATPIVWGDRIFLVSAVPFDEAAYAESQKAAAEKLERREWPPAVQPVKQRFVVQARSRADGSVIWERTAAEKVPHESHYIDSSFASASPVTDGEVLLAHFGSNGLYAYDLEGELLWSVDLGDMRTRNGFGEGSSPALYGDVVVINWDHEDDSFVVALDRKTGRELWRTERPGEVSTWATPLVVESSRGPQVVIPGTGRSRGYSLETGEELWSLGGMTVNVIPSPIYRDGLVYLASGYRGTMLQAVDVESAKGEVGAESGLAWQYERDTPYVPSVLEYGGQLYFVKHFKNILSSLDAASGEVIFKEKRMTEIDNVYASPVAAAGRIYVLGRGGDALVLEHGRDYKVLAHNVLDDGFDASPAIVGDEMYLRGREHLYCLARLEVGEEASS
jgi:outer membrane protein assembly factor BamB